MGQTSSSPFHNSSQPLFSRRKSSRIPPASVPLPEDPPVPATAPKSPTYAVAENKVLPNGVLDMHAARKQLRPVSQELSKFHPDFVDIFDHKSEAMLQKGNSSSMDDILNMRNNDKENAVHTLNTSSDSTHIARVANGRPNHVRNNSISNHGITSLDNFVPYQNKTEYSIPRYAANLVRSESLGDDFAQHVKVPQHKRQLSLASAGSIQEHVIAEDPREHLYNVARHAPFSNFQPSTTSLPVKNTFNMEYSMNLTYAQLTEYRRNNRVSELEERTGRKMKELEAEISASNTVPKSPFDLQNRGGWTRTNSISTGSSDTGVSKSKKKRAPAPPPPALQASRYVTRENSVVSESPFRYSMSNISAFHTNLHGTSLQRSISSVSKSTKPPAPLPLPKSQPSVIIAGSGVTNSEQSSNSISSQSATLPRLASNKDQRFDAPHSSFLPDTAVKQSIAEAKAQLESLTKLQNLLKSQKPVEKSTQENEADAATSNGHDIVTDLMNIIKTETDRDDSEKTADTSFDKAGQLDLCQTEVRVTKVIPTGVNQTEVCEAKVMTTEVNQIDVHQTKATGIDVNERKVHQTKVMATEVKRTEVHQTELRETELPVPEPHETDVYHHRIYDVEEKTPDALMPQADQSSTRVFYSHSAPDKYIEDPSPSSATKEQGKKMNFVLQRDIVLAAKARQNKANISERSFQTSEGSHRIHKEPLTEVSLEEARITSLPHSKERSADHELGNQSTHRTDWQPAAPHQESATTVKLLRQTNTDHFKTKASKSTNSIKKDEDRLFQTGNDMDHEDRSSASSMDFPKRSSIQSEDMSISSSNASQRVFSPDWAPEHDLDSDDDIMDESYIKAERRISSEGFKPSVVPKKVTDLKENKQKTSRKNKIRSEKDEAQLPIENEKPKFGSIRKFQKSVHQTVKQAFGSISKATGTVLRKQKSQEFLDRRVSADLDDYMSESFRNPNWMLSNSRRGSSSRNSTDGFIHQQQFNKAEGFEQSESSDDEVGDIDFAEGINDSPKVRKTSGHITEEQPVKVLKRAGVAYVSGKGQIVVLPDYHTVQFDEFGRIVNDTQNNVGHAPKIHKTKDRKYNYESTVRIQEKRRLHENLARNISEQEHNFEMERLRQKETERNFRYLRDLETEEPKQRQQNYIIQEQTAVMKRQQQLELQEHSEMNNNAVSLPSLSNVGVVTNIPGMSIASPKTDPFSVSSPYVVNDSTAILQTRYLDSSLNLGPVVDFQPPQRYSMPTFPLTAVAQPMSQSVIENAIIDPVNYQLHPTSVLVGSAVSGGFNSSTTPNLTPQELAYLSEYMRMIGVPPPVTQQQWAVLLSTVAGNTGTVDFPGFRQYYALQTLPSGRIGPDLSHIFGNTNTQSNFTVNSNKQILDDVLNHQTAEPEEITSLQKFHGSDINTFSNLQNSNLQNSNLQNSNLQNSNLQNSNLQNFNFEQNSHIYNLDISAKQLNNYEAPVTKTVPVNVSTINISTSDFHSTEEKINSFLPTRVVIQSDNHTVKRNTFDLDEKTQVNSSTNRQLPAKVYGPIGFRPVSFQTGSTR